MHARELETLCPAPPGLATANWPYSLVNVITYPDWMTFFMIYYICAIVGIVFKHCTNYIHTSGKTK